MRHNEACRARLYDLMRKAGTGKVEDADAEGDHRTRTKGNKRQKPATPEEEQKPSDAS